MRIIGRWVPEPMIPAEKIEGAALIELLSSRRVWELMYQDLTVFDGQNSYPRLRLVRHQLRQFSNGNTIWHLSFVRNGAPWCQPLYFCCRGVVQDHSPILIIHPLIRELTIGYPTYPPAKWVVNTEVVA